MDLWLVQVVAILMLVAPSGIAEPTKFARFEHQGAIRYGIVVGEEVAVLEGSPFGEYSKTGETLSLDGIDLLVPCEPTKVFGAAGNMAAKGAQSAPKPDHPELFFKAVSALIPVGGTVVLPHDSERVLYEGEVVAVIGRRAKDVTPEQATEYILGITAGNDVSGADWGEDFQAWRVKATDTFAPCGPFLVTGVDYDDLDFELRLNGETRQKANTSDLIHSIPELVSFISRYITLEPGDLIYAGTQPPVDILQDGDVVEVEVEGVGTLVNRVVKEHK